MSVAYRSSSPLGPPLHASVRLSGDQVSPLAFCRTPVMLVARPSSVISQRLSSAMRATRPASGASARPVKPRARCSLPGAGNRSGGSAGRSCVKRMVAVKGISVGAPPSRSTDHSRPYRTKIRRCPSGAHATRPTGFVEDWAPAVVAVICRRAPPPRSWTQISALPTASCCT